MSLVLPATIAAGQAGLTATQSWRGDAAWASPHGNAQDAYNATIRAPPSHPSLLRPWQRRATPTASASSRRKIRVLERLALHARAVARMGVPPVGRLLEVGRAQRPADAQAGGRRGGRCAPGSSS